MATYQRIILELGRLATTYRQSISTAELKVLGGVWSKALEKLEDQDFLRALEKHYRRSRFFPVPADILLAHEALQESRPPRAALDTRTASPAEAALNRINAAMLVLSLKKGARAQKARAYFQSGDERQKEALARELLDGGLFPPRGDKLGREML